MRPAPAYPFAALSLRDILDGVAFPQLLSPGFCRSF
jgi:hypothetical protein